MRIKWFEWVAGTALVVSLVGTTGCGAVHHSASFEPSFAAQPGMLVEVASVTNTTGKSYEVDIISMLRDQLTTALQKESLLSQGGASGQQLAMDVKIIEYEEGDAFKRWLLPGWGETVLSVECDLKRKADGRKVGSIQARRTVSVGGAYSIGAWRTIVESVSKDVVKEVQTKLRT